MDDRPAKAETVAGTAIRRRGGRAAARERFEATPSRDAAGSGSVNAWSLTPGDTATRTLVIACGALIGELRQIVELNLWDHIEITAIPADYHNTPEKIADAVRTKIRWAKTPDPEDASDPEHASSPRPRYAQVLIGFGDCGTRGALDAMLAEEGVARIEGAHCYAFYAGLDTFEALHAGEPGTFYLTDFLARHFDALTIRGLGIDRHPELKQTYFGNYSRVVHLVQVPDAATALKAAEIADWFGLPLVTRDTGFGGLQGFLPRG